MELRSCLRLLFTVSCHMAILTGTSADYDTYFVEESCQFGCLNISLADGGQTSAVFLRATERTSYSIAMDCRINITAPASHRIMVSILQLGFRKNYLRGTCKDYIKIKREMCEDLLRLEEEHHILSDDNTMQIFYHVSQDGLDNKTFSGFPGMKLTVTASREKSICPSTDDKDWFRCDSGYCIWSGLKCDSHNNCGDLSDEQDCGTGGGNKSTVLIILGCLIVLLMVIMCIATLLCSKNEQVVKLRSRTMSYLRRFST